jgi:hypothetical protein
VTKKQTVSRMKAAGEWSGRDRRVWSARRRQVGLVDCGWGCDETGSKAKSVVADEWVVVDGGTWEGNRVVCGRKKRKSNNCRCRRVDEWTSGRDLPGRPKTVTPTTLSSPLEQRQS